MKRLLSLCPEGWHQNASAHAPVCQAAPAWRQGTGFCAGAQRAGGAAVPLGQLPGQASYETRAYLAILRIM